MPQTRDASASRCAALRYRKRGSGVTPNGCSRKPKNFKNISSFLLLMINGLVGGWHVISENRADEEVGLNFLGRPQRQFEVSAVRRAQRLSNDLRNASVAR